jgi:hypothetical protein
MANIPVNGGGFIISGSQTITGSFAGMMALAGGLSASITGLKYINGYTVVPNGKGFNDYIAAETTISTAFGLANGSKLDLIITSCSLAAGSSPVVFYT